MDSVVLSFFLSLYREQMEILSTFGNMTGMDEITLSSGIVYLLFFEDSLFIVIVAQREKRHFFSFLTCFVGRRLKLFASVFMFSVCSRLTEAAS